MPVIEKNNRRLYVKTQKIMCFYFEINACVFPERTGCDCRCFYAHLYKGRSAVQDQQQTAELPSCFWNKDS